MDSHGRQTGAEGYGRRTHHARAALFALVLLLAGVSASASSPQDALAYTSPELLAATARLNAAGGMLTAQGWQTTATLGGNRVDGKDGYSFYLRYANNPTGVMDARRAQAKALQELQRLQRDAARDALLAYAAHWEGALNAKAAATRVAAAKLMLAETLRKQKLGAVSSLDVDIARLDAEDADLSAQQAAETLKNAVAKARHYGLRDAPDATCCAFTLPERKIDDNPTFQDLLWEQRVAETRLKAARREARPSLGVDFNYIGVDTQMSLGLSTRGPDASVQVGYPSLYDPTLLQYGMSGWSTTYRVQIPLDPVVFANVHSAGAEVELANVKISELRKVLETDIADARAAAHTAERSLTLARGRAALAERKYQAVLAQVKAGSVSQLAAQQEETTLTEAQLRVATAWKSYVQTVAAYLSLVDGQWEVKP